MDAKTIPTFRHQAFYTMSDPDPVFPDPQWVDISSSSSSSSSDDTETREAEIPAPPSATEPSPNNNTSNTMTRPPSPLSLPKKKNKRASPNTPSSSKRTSHSGDVVMAMMDEFEKDITRIMVGGGDVKTSTPTKRTSKKSTSSSSPVMLAPMMLSSKSTSGSPSKKTKMEESSTLTTPTVIDESNGSSSPGKNDSRAAHNTLQRFNSIDKKGAVHVFDDDEQDDEEKLAFRRREEDVDATKERSVSPTQLSSANDGNSMEAQILPDDAERQDVLLEDLEHDARENRSEDQSEAVSTLTAIPFKESFFQQKKKLILIGGLITLLVVLGGVGVAVYLLAFNDSKAGPTESPTISPAPTFSPAPTSTPSAAPIAPPSVVPTGSPTKSPQPSATPSASPTRDYRGDLEAFLFGEYALDVTAQGPSSPVAFAADWIVQELLEKNENASFDNALLQRFALVTLEMSLQEDLENDKRQLRVPSIATRNVNECDWKGVKCNDQGEVVKVDWSDQDGWRGNIPAEIRLFFHLQHLDLSNNRIGRTIPDELYSLSELTHLYLYKNRLSGSISPKIGRLDKIVRLHLSHNNLNGSIPQQIESDSGSVDGIRPLGEYENDVRTAPISNLFSYAC